MKKKPTLILLGGMFFAFGSMAQTNLALSFDGTNDYVAAPLPMSVTDNFTIEAWIYPAIFNGIQIPISYGFDNGLAGNGASICINGHTLQILFSGVAFFSSGYAFPAPNQWYHVAFSRSAGISRVYVNGIQTPNTSLTNPLPPNFFRIGSQYGLRFFKGKIDEVRLWNVARTQNEIQSSMSCVISGNEPGLKAFYNFNNLAAIPNGNNLSLNNLVDNSGNGNNAMLIDFELLNSNSNWVASGTTTYYQDLDADGFGNASQSIESCIVPTGYIRNHSDCNDANAGVNIGIREVCNGLDDDCDGNVDFPCCSFAVACTSSPASCLTSQNGTASVNVSGGLAPFSYLWSNGQTSASISNLAAGTYSVTVSSNSNAGNLLFNPSFNLGNTGFASNYIYTPFNKIEGRYYVGTSPSSFNPFFTNIGDHTNGSGNMMIVNGDTVMDVMLWAQQINIAPNTVYTFSGWLSVLVNGGPPQLQVKINGSQIGNLISFTDTVGIWQSFSVQWNSSNNTSALIEIFDANPEVFPNDFAIDDLVFAAPCTQTCSVTVGVASLANSPACCAACGEKKMLICHIPPGNPANQHTICVSINAVPTHFSHGDYCGPCVSSRLAELHEDKIVDGEETETHISNYPEPFNNKTSIVFTSKENTHLRLEIYSILGTKVSTLFDENIEGGKEYTVEFDGSNLNSGLYLYKAITSKESLSGRMMLTR